MSTGTAGPAQSAFDRALDQLGQEIVDGVLAPERTDTVEGFVQRTGASRSVVREVTRVLAARGMLSAGRRVGLRILPAEHWDALDPRVIRWRLGGPEAEVQVHELRALRLAVEPQAAADAAVAVRDRSHPADDLRAAGRALQAAGRDGESGSFLRKDQRFHRIVLEMSGNAMLIRLGRVVEEGLRHRALVERADLPPEPHDMELHAEVAAAIRSGDPHAAAEAMRRIIQRTTQATDPARRPR